MRSLTSLVATLAALVACVGAPAADASQQPVHGATAAAASASFSDLCASYRTSSLRCSTGFKRVDGKLTQFQGKFVDSGAKVILRADSSTCSVVKIKFWHQTYASSTFVSIATTEGTFKRVARRAHRSATVTARVPADGIFRVSAGSVRGYGGPDMFFTGSATC